VRKHIGHSQVPSLSVHDSLGASFFSVISFNTTESFHPCLVILFVDDGDCDDEGTAVCL